MPRFILCGVVCALVASLLALPVAAATRTVTNTNDTGAGSLRQALTDAQAGDRIEFSIGSGPRTIQVVSTDLPMKTAFITIDSTTQPGYSGTPLIEITGNYPLTNIGLNVNGDIRGLIINGFDGAAIRIARGTVRGCYLGTDPTGMIARPDSHGIIVGRENDPPGQVTIGGPNPGDGNLIAGNTYGVTVQHGSSISVQGNVFGCNVAQTAVLGAPAYHVGAYMDGVRIGDEAPNVFVGADGTAVSVGQGSVVVNNYFGVTPAGTVLPNHDGLWITQGTAESNVFKGNTGIAVMPYRARVIYNRMEGNGFGIDLNFDGVTPNDDGDGDYFNLNYPDLFRAKIDGSTVVLTGFLSAPSLRVQRIDLYTNSTCHASGHGEGRDWLMAFELTPDDHGHIAFERVLPLLPAGTIITATTWNDFDGSSEFSNCVTVEGPGTFAFESASGTASEGTGASVKIVRQNGAAGDATVTWSVTAGTATPGTDFTPASGTLAFADGETSKTLSIPLINDTTHEDPQTIIVQLTGASTSVGTPSSTTITINDDDAAPRVSGSGFQNVPEGDAGNTPVAVKFHLSAPSEAPLSVPWTLYLGHATNGVDFIAPAGGTLEFAPGQTETSVVVQIVGDTLYERPTIEFFMLLLPDNQRGATINIEDDDPVPTVSVNSMAVKENDLSTTITLTASQPISGVVLVTFQDGTAKAGSDYVNDPRYVSFNNASHATTPFVLIDDSTPEATESLRVVVTPVSADLQASENPGSGVITILDDEMTLSPQEQSIPVGQRGEFIVTLGAPAVFNTVVTLTTDAPDAISIPATLTIPAGATSAMFEARALVAGRAATIFASAGGATREALVRTYTKATLRFTPSRLDMKQGETAEVTVSVEPANAMTIGLTSTGPASVPQSIYIPAGGTAKFIVTATGIGAFSIDAHLPGEHGNEVQSLFGNVSPNDAMPAPRIAAVLPAIGTTSGGTQVRVTGGYFDSSCWLFFGSRAAEHVVFRDAHSLTGSTPYYPGVFVDVTVRCTGGEFTSAAAFEYVAANDAPAIIIGFEPSMAAPGELVTLRGSHFRSDLVATFGTTTATILDVQPDSLVLRVPDVAPVATKIYLTDKSGRVSPSGMMIVLAARPVRIDSVAPATVPAGGELEITGNGFRPGLTFRAGGVDAEVVSLDYKHAVLRLAANAAQGEQVVQIGDATAPVTITAHGLVITSVDPRCSSTSGGGFANIRGAGFSSASVVTFDDVPATGISLIDAATLRVRIPAGSAGPARIAVTDGTSHATLTGEFTYESPFAPRSACAGRTRAARN